MDGQDQSQHKQQDRRPSQQQQRQKEELKQRPKQQKLEKGMTTFQSAGTNFLVEDKYEYIKQVGHGAYGVVVSALDHSIKAKVAIKKVPKAFEDLIDAKRIVREIKLLKFFDHENIIGLVSLLKSQLCLELLNHGNSTPNIFSGKNRVKILAFSINFYIIIGFHL